MGEGRCSEKPLIGQTLLSIKLHHYWKLAIWALKTIWGKEYFKTLLKGTPVVATYMVLKKKKITHYQEYSSSEVEAYKHNCGRELQTWVYPPNLIPTGMYSSCYYMRKRLALIKPQENITLLTLFNLFSTLLDMC